MPEGSKTLWPQNGDSCKKSWLRKWWVVPSTTKTSKEISLPTMKVAFCQHPQQLVPLHLVCVKDWHRVVFFWIANTSLSPYFKKCWIEKFPLLNDSISYSLKFWLWPPAHIFILGEEYKHFRNSHEQYYKLKQFSYRNLVWRKEFKWWPN